MDTRLPLEAQNVDQNHVKRHPLCTKVTHPTDKIWVTKHIFLVFSQLSPTQFTNTMRELGKYKDMESISLGFLGLICKHCQGGALLKKDGNDPQVDYQDHVPSRNESQEKLLNKQKKFRSGYGEGTYFCKSPNAIEKSSFAIHRHLIRCSFCPQKLKEELVRAKETHEQDLITIPRGAQKAFFRRVWKRLHNGRSIADVDCTNRELKTVGNDTCQLNLSVTGTSDKKYPLLLPSSKRNKKGGNKLYLEERANYNSSREKRKTSNTFVEVPVGWSCTRCCWVPLRLRANGSVVVGEDSPEESVVRIHNEACKGDRLHLKYALNIVTSMVMAIPSMSFEILVHPAYKAIVSALVGHKEELVTVFTDGVRFEYFGIVNDGGGRSGLWSLFPGKVDMDELVIAMAAFVGSRLQIPISLFENRYFIEYVKTITPGCSFVVPGVKEVAGYLNNLEKNQCI